MYRVVLAFALSGLLSVLAFLAPRPALAGGYYDDDYRYESYRPARYYDERPSYRPYRADCCYRRVVRYERTWRDYDRPYYRPHYHSYYDRPYYDRPYRPYYSSYRSYDGWNYGRPWYERGPSYSYTSYYDYPRYSYDYPRYSYSSYRSSSYTDWPRYTSNWDDQPRKFYPPGCRPSQYKVYDDAGGWVWGKTASCGGW